MKRKCVEQEQGSRKLQRMQHHAVVAKEADRISDLPQDLIEHVISYLPIRDTIRTSALSRSWRGRWRSAVRHLHFDEREFAKTMEWVELPIWVWPWKILGNPTFDDAVTGVLNSVTGSIDSFKLSMQARYQNDCAERWMQAVVSHGATALDVSNVGIFSMPFPESAFSCRGLTSLVLHGLVVTLPLGLPAFEQLTKLKLHGCKFGPEGELARLISNSPCLTELEITDTEKGCEDLEISLPTLRYLHILSLFEGETVSLKNCPNLERAYIHTLAPDRRFIDIVHSLCTKIKVLDLMVASLDDDHIPQRLPYELPQLYSLKLGISMWLECDLMAAYCTLRSSPALRDLTVSFVQEECEENISVTALDLWEGEEWQALALNQLSSVMLDCSLVIMAESSKILLEFCNLVLADSPNLHSLTVKITYFPWLPSEEERKIHRDQLRNDLAMFPKASENVKIKVEIQDLFD